MRRFGVARVAAAIAVGAGTSLFSTTSAAAQSLAERINGAPDGPVEFSFAPRAGVRGDGRGFIEMAAGGATTSVRYSASTFGNSGDARSSRRAASGRLPPDHGIFD